MTSVRANPQFKAAVFASLLLALFGLIVAFGGTASVQTFDGVEANRQAFYLPGLLITSLGALAALYASKGSQGLLWTVAVVAVVYSGLIVFGAGPLPLVGSVLLLGTIIGTSLRTRNR